MSNHSIVRQTYLKHKKILAAGSSGFAQKFENIKTAIANLVPLNEKQAQWMLEKEACRDNALLFHVLSLGIAAVKFLRTYMAPPCLMVTGFMLADDFLPKLQKIYADPSRKPFKSLVQLAAGIMGGMYGYKVGFGIAAWGVGYIAPIGLAFGIIALLSGKTGMDYLAGALQIVPFGLMFIMPSTTPFLSVAITAVMCALISMKLSSALTMAWNTICYGRRNSRGDCPSHKVVSYLLQTVEFKNKPEKIGEALALLQFSGATLVVQCPKQADAFETTKTLQEQDFIRNNFYESQHIVPALKAAIA